MVCPSGETAANEQIWVRVRGTNTQIRLKILHLEGLQSKLRIIVLSKDWYPVLENLRIKLPNQIEVSISERLK